jgi:arsenate reductase
MRTFIFACVHNAGRSQISAALFNLYANPKEAHAISAGTQPGTLVHTVVVEAMREIGIDLSMAKPQKLTAELASGAEMLITMGCGEDCPLIPEIQREDWPLPDPKGKEIEEVRAIRDEIAQRISALVERKGVGR